MTGSPLIDLAGRVSVDPDKVVALEHDMSSNGPPRTIVHVEGASHPFSVPGSVAEVTALLWRPEYTSPPGLGRLVSGPAKPEPPDPAVRRAMPYDH